MTEGLYPRFLPEEKLSKVIEKYAPFPFDFEAAIKRYDTPTIKTVPTLLSSHAAWRIYTEWCMDKERGGGQKWDRHRDYNGEAFENFLEDERLYASQRANCDISIDQVVDAFARSTLGFFIDNCNWSTMSPKREGVNIRRSLAPWMDSPKLIRL